MSITKTNSEILNQILNGHDLDAETSNTLMKRWLNDEILEVQTGAFLSAFRAKGATGNELSSMAEVLLNACEMPLERPDLFIVDTCGTCLLYTSPSPRD